MPETNQYSIYDIIDKIRDRPGMWIGDLSPRALHIFLTGYRCGMDDAGFAGVSQPEFRGFHDWVAQKFGFGESTAGWANMILAVTVGAEPANISWESLFASVITTEQNKQATMLCFQLIDEYRSSVR